jgi:hypothetical protein
MVPSPLRDRRPGSSGDGFTALRSSWRLSLIPPGRLAEVGVAAVPPVAHPDRPSAAQPPLWPYRRRRWDVRQPDQPPIPRECHRGGQARTRRRAGPQLPRGFRPDRHPPAARPRSPARRARWPCDAIEAPTRSGAPTRRSYSPALARVVRSGPAPRASSSPEHATARRSRSDVRAVVARSLPTRFRSVYPRRLHRDYPAGGGPRPAATGADTRWRTRRRDRRYEVAVATKLGFTSLMRMRPSCRCHVVGLANSEEISFAVAEPCATFAGGASGWVVSGDVGDTVDSAQARHVDVFEDHAAAA